MKTSTIRSLVIAVALAAPLSAAEDRKQVFSGPQPGEKLAGFQVRGLFGGGAGKTYDPVKQSAGKPLMLIFVHKFNEPVIGMMLTLTRYTETRSEAGLKTFVVWLGKDTGDLEAKLKRARRAMPPKTPVGISPDGAEGPGAYGLNRKVQITVLVAKSGKVAANFALLQPSIRSDAVPILKGLVKVIGGRAPTLAQLTRRPGNKFARQAINGIERMLSPKATDEVVIKIAKQIESIVKNRGEVRRRVGGVAYEITQSNRFTDRNKKALEYLKKWAKLYRSKEND